MCWYGCVDEYVCVGMNVYVGVGCMNHCVLVWVCG